MTNSPETPQRPVVAVINSAEETAEMLQDVLDDAGFLTVVAYVVDFKRGRQDLRAFFAAHQPQAVVWDIALPYSENWNFFRDNVLDAGLLPTECYVLTTANKTVLDLLVGSTPTFELVGRPYDLDVIREATQRAVKR
jgi:CheY-like chemotaxis protein